jgi:hypothetical protein
VLDVSERSRGIGIENLKMGDHVPQRRQHYRERVKREVICCGLLGGFEIKLAIRQQGRLEIVKVRKPKLFKCCGPRGDPSVSALAV